MPDNKQPTNQSAVPGSLVPDIVKEIPVATQGAKFQPSNEDDELDKIMRDVGQDIRQIGKKKTKHSWFGRPKKTKPGPTFSAQPAEQLQPSPDKPTKLQQSVPPAVSSPMDKPKAATTPTPAKTRPPKTSSTPVGAILTAILISIGLLVAAYYAYK